MAILGLVGFIGSGKGTVGDILAEKYGFERESFAKPVKDAVAPIFGWERSLLEGDTVQSRMWREQPDAFWSKKLGFDFTPRYALQLMGTEAGRNVFHDSVWVHSLEKRLSRDKDYVVTDTRFPNEMDMIKENGGSIIWVSRGDQPAWWGEAVATNLMSKGKIQKLKNYPDIHYSEWAWLGYPVDAHITNDGTLEDLHNSIEKVLTLKKKESTI